MAARTKKTNDIAVAEPPPTTESIRIIPVVVPELKTGEIEILGEVIEAPTIWERLDALDTNPVALALLGAIGGAAMVSIGLMLVIAL